MTTRPRGNPRLAFAVCCLMAGSALLPGALDAQAYPVKPVRLIVPQPPGGGNDTIARPVSELRVE